MRRIELLKSQLEAKETEMADALAEKDTQIEMWRERYIAERRRRNDF